MAGTTILRVLSLGRHSKIIEASHSYKQSYKHVVDA